MSCCHDDDAIRQFLGWVDEMVGRVNSMGKNVCEFVRTPDSDREAVLSIIRERGLSRVNDTQKLIGSCRCRNTKSSKTGTRGVERAPATWARQKPGDEARDQKVLNQPEEAEVYLYGDIAVVTLTARLPSDLELGNRAPRSRRYFEVFTCQENRWQPLKTTS
jgi:hypothetical protein